jgi:hypothetical protein
MLRWTEEASELRIRTRSVPSMFIGPALLLLLTGLAWAQQDTNPKHPLQSPAAVKGTIGGEAHDSYVIQARKGQAISVRISWQRAAGNQADFSVSESPALRLRSGSTRTPEDAGAALSRRMRATTSMSWPIPKHTTCPRWRCDSSAWHGSTAKSCAFSRVVLCWRVG